jgi:hypothetical protein
MIPIAFNANTVDHLSGEPTESVRTSRPIMSLTPARIITISEAGRHQPRSDRPSGRSHYRSLRASIHVECSANVGRPRAAHSWR